MLLALLPLEVSGVVTSKYTSQNTLPRLVIVMRCSPSPVESEPGEVYTSVLNVSCVTFAVVAQNVGASLSIWNDTLVRYTPMGRLVAKTFT